MPGEFHIRICKRLILICLFLFMSLLDSMYAHLSFAEERFSQERLKGDEEIPWQITAKSLTYREGEDVIAEGDVVITKEDQALYAQRAVYNASTGIAEVWGDVKFQYGKDVFTGQSGVFDLRKRTGKIRNGHLFLAENHYYINGELIEKTGEDSYLIKKCHVTTCDGDKPAWSISGSEVKVTVEGYGTVKHAAFRIRGMPLLYVPYMIFPAKTKRQTGLLPPRIGRSTRNGIDTEVPFFWAISDQADATFYQRYLSKRGYMQGVEFRYITDEDSEGAFLFDILSDKEEKDLDDPDDVEISPFPRTNRTRSWLRGKADQDLPLELTARLDVDFVSDQDYLREFETALYGFEARPDLVEQFGRPLEERRSPLRTSTLRLSRDQDDYSLQVAGTYHQRPEDPRDDPTAQPLGGFNFILPPKKIMNSPFFLSLNSDYDYVWREEGQTGHRAFLTPEFRVPLWFGPYLEFEPSFRYEYNIQWIDEDIESADRQYKGAYDAQGALRTNLDRIYDLDWQNAKKLKHRIRPILSYRYRVPQDEEDESPWFEPIDVEGRVNRLAFTLENYLDARLEGTKGEVDYRQWATLSLTQGYDIDEVRTDKEPGEDRRPFEPLNVNMRVQPFANIDFVGVADWDHYDQEIVLADVSFELSLDRSGAKKDRFKLDYQFEEDGQETLSYWFNVNLLYGFSAGSSLKRDLDINANISNSYWLGYDSQCWGAKIVAEVEEDETTVTFLFNLLGLGEIKPL